MEHKIYTGTFNKIKGKGFLAGSLRIMYCGMPDPQTFTLAPFKAEGYHGFSPNIYYDISASAIRVLDKTFGIVDVTPEYIICLLYTSPSPRDGLLSRMPSSA